ncbi:MAG TPA: hypothetical protein VHS58_22265 [Acetobacteraceae bacterium]|nr:hypothetical protein [Acetobacteraceae bacterium]
MRQIAERAAGPWLEYREAEVRADRATGRKAMSTNIALLERRHADFEAGLIGRAKAAVLALRAEVGVHASDLRRQLEDLARERDEHIGQKLIETRENRQVALQHLERTAGPLSARYAAAAKAVEDAERGLRAIRADVSGRPLRTAFVPFYLAALVALALIEVPVNRLAFELFFQEQPIFSLLLALAAGAVLIFFAHIVGTLIRRVEQPSPRAQQARRIGAIALFLILAGGLIYVLASMRQLYVHLLESEQGSLQQQVEALTNRGAASAISNVASTNLGTAGVTLLVINVVLFAVGAALSFMRHDPHPDYEAAHRAELRARRRLTRLRARYERVVGVRRQGFDQQQRALDALLRETQGKYDDVAGRAAAVEPFVNDTLALIANTVRNRSLAFLEGAIAALPPGSSHDSVSGLRAHTEAEIRAAILPAQGHPG